MEQHTVGERTVNVVGGFAGWFEAGGPAPVRRWKSAAVVLLGLIPVSLAFLALAGGCSPTSTRWSPRWSATSSGSWC